MSSVYLSGLHLYCVCFTVGHQSLTSGMELKSNTLVSGNADSTVKVSKFACSCDPVCVCVCVCIRVCACACTCVRALSLIHI